MTENKRQKQMTKKPQQNNDGRNTRHRCQESVNKNDREDKIIDRNMTGEIQKQK